MAEKLKVHKYQDGVEIVGNREGLRQLAEICLTLSNLAENDAGTAANHYHIADYMNNAEEGSIPLVIRLSSEL
jgi:hypothetical protein